MKFSLLIPQCDSKDDSESEKLVIDDKDLKYDYLIKGNQGAGEIEIVAQGGIYIGSFVAQTNLEEVC